MKLQKNYRDGHLKEASRPVTLKSRIRLLRRRILGESSRVLITVTAVQAWSALERMLDDSKCSAWDKMEES